jgi:hypothetical protein
MSDHYRLIESPNSHGKIFHDNEFVTEISYRLQVRQRIEILRTTSGPRELPSHREITGALASSPRGLSDLSELYWNNVPEKLTLELEDGRLLDFGFRDNSGSIAGLSDFYSTKQ